MAPEDWEKKKQKTKAQLTVIFLIKIRLKVFSWTVFLSMTINTGGYCGQSHKICYYEAIRKINFITPLGERKAVRDEIDQWIASNQETCLFCAEPFLLLNHKD